MVSVMLLTPFERTVADWVSGAGSTDHSPLPSCSLAKPFIMGDVLSPTLAMLAVKTSVSPTSLRLRSEQGDKGGALAEQCWRPLARPPLSRLKLSVVGLACSWPWSSALVLYWMYEGSPDSEQKIPLLRQ